MTPEYINKKAYEKYPVAMDQRTDSLGFGDFNAPPRQGYIEAYKEISSFPTIKGWVARDKDGTLCFYSNAKPWRYDRRFDEDPHQHREGDVMRINGDLLPTLRWEDEPIEVELPIIRK